ncbi:hypothetical protein [Chryseobacterium sediminis]|uniref:TonB-dependent receptor plug domain-containing protein n=1 Tax=Chryseobacterium sediminis TaxID=1679494 RepID=A0A5B2UAV3_9FLAO|nr:hypothetical protein [Chryseobacterium sediminis]KAA2223583.1 hypothetical protein FW780_05100 [Chryseobacterium sediminis]
MSKKLITLLAISAIYCLNAQTNAEEALKTFEKKYPQEKIHLLLDKSNYIAGETLWFKSFVFDGYTTSAISTTLFVELYDSNKNQISKKLIPLINGEGSGNVALPSSLKEDVYYIRAYTSWMANFNEDFQILKPVAVYNPSSPEKLTSNPTPWTVSAYPESGTFIDGINTKVAVRLQSNGTAPSDWEGYVTEIDNPDTKITTFKGFDQNIGSFNIIPKSGKRYQLIVQDKNGQKQNISLPEVSASGINLQVSSDKDHVKYTIKSKNLAPDYQYYTVLGTINNQLVYKAKINKINNETQYSISNSQLVNGILQLTVFDDKENVVSNRLVFVQPQLLQFKQPSLQSVLLKDTPRGKNSFELPKDTNYSNYSVLVLDASTQSPEEDQSLLSSLWLTGDITSPIISPAQYFTKNRNTEALDALLMSEKWKRFEWKSIMTGNYPMIKYQPESYLSYKGKVNIQGKPAPNTEVNLIFGSEPGSRMSQIKSDNNGFLTLNNLVFEDTMKFFYQLNSEPKDLNNNYSIYFQPTSNFVPYKKNIPPSPYKLIPRPADDKPSNEVSRSFTALNAQKIIRENITNIEEIKLKGEVKNKTKKLNDELSSPGFKSLNEQIFDFVNDSPLTTSSNVLKWLQGRVAGLTIQMQGGSYKATMRGGQVGIYLDEMLVDPSHVDNMSTSDIAMVKVIKGFFAGGFGGANGAIAIYSRRGTSSNRTASSKLRQISLQGYDKETPFENPDYGNDNFKSITQDTRSVLYWSSFLETQPNESSKVQFYNNDDTKKFRVIIMGYDKNNDTPLYYNEILP